MMLSPGTIICIFCLHDTQLPSPELCHSILKRAIALYDAWVCSRGNTSRWMCNAHAHTHVVLVIKGRGRQWSLARWNHSQTEWLANMYVCLCVGFKEESKGGKLVNIWLKFNMHPFTFHFIFIFYFFRKENLRAMFVCVCVCLRFDAKTRLKKSLQTSWRRKAARVILSLFTNVYVACVCFVL